MGEKRTRIMGLRAKLLSTRPISLLSSNFEQSFGDSVLKVGIVRI